MLAFELATKERDLPGTTPLVAMALMEIAVSSVCTEKRCFSRVSGSTDPADA